MERIYVTVRARPLSTEDAKASPWRISGNSIFIPNNPSKFEFDRVFGEDCKTLDVYQARTKDIVAAAVHGFNGTVFAYGQTNSGKTYTMRGSLNEPGVIPLAVHDLFDIIQENVDREFLLRMSYMEIYNEDINDLLAPEHRKLQIHESLERGIYVAGLREEIVASPQQVLGLMEFGESHRHIGETNMNVYSSRSHTIFRMIIESRDKTEDSNISNSCDAVRVSVLNLVDLAGSERAAKTGAEGVRLKEGSHINKSLMTLGTVIKKLSEGAESQGGHVPYRDSKLTRILQPALGGNANTAIICNITLAQIHTDETKSSLQFASRALCVTNCARVNEILTDAALLKRQKKEIEELRAKLQASHSEHLEEEILNLRNTLLQSELERERIALELEEEKKVQAERERVLQEQAKKIKNLSSMVLYSNRDENRDHLKKEKRRDTWCPSNLSRGTFREVPDVKSMRTECDLGPVLPFEQLLNETEVVDESSKQDEDCNDDSSQNCNLPGPHTLLHVTNRRKVPLRKQSTLDSELEELQAEYEDLLLKFESQRTMSEIQIDCLTRNLGEADLSYNMKFNDCSIYSVDKSTPSGDESVNTKESEAILVVKQLQEKIKLLEMEKSSSQQNLDNLAEPAMEQNVCAREKFNEFSMEIQEIMCELQNMKEVVDAVSSVVDDVFQSLSAIYKEYSELKALMHLITVQQNSVISGHEKLHFCMRHNISELESEKVLLDNQSVDLQRQMHEALLEQQNLEKSKFLSHIQTLEKELLCLSSSSLVKEKESLRKDLEKMKTKLKETEFKLKNVIQEKTKLEGEKAIAEREIKRLHGQKTLLERDISKRDSLASKKRDSIVDRSSKVSDIKRGKSFSVPYEQMQEDYKNLEVLAFEMETTIASLEAELAGKCREGEEAILRNETLALELEILSDKFKRSHIELNMLQEEVSGLKLSLEESKSNEQKMQSSVQMLLKEKEELAVQLMNSLLEMEEEKAIWSAKEKASIETIDEKVKLYHTETKSLSKRMLEVENELQSSREECEVLRERLMCLEQDIKLEKKCSLQKSLEIDKLRNDLESVEHKSNQVDEMLKSKLEKLTSDFQQAQEKVNKGHNDNIEWAKLRMRLRWTQVHLDALRRRYRQAVVESDNMNKQFEEASAKLKELLASKGIEVLNLKKQLTALTGQ
ncbi:kinesin-like protein KIN-7O isoform X2 [Mangifera indica]|uniref:kinesin-like protein KIN-7O isoform X2 n=1 Tax=Mangifera indica TaxID=29780 RepID=UPI001CFB6CD4|nr:kinesin-like protein KIN-7O isoform X2 [Mangifera indica]